MRKSNAAAGEEGRLPKLVEKTKLVFDRTQYYDRNAGLSVLQTVLEDIHKG
ncbi:MAG: hypothetical protein QW829_04000 [Candidatus Bathyarchaeia archaeon]